LFQIGFSSFEQEKQTVERVKDENRRGNCNIRNEWHRFEKLGFAWFNGLDVFGFQIY
jgi:hypothetical protein